MRLFWKEQSDQGLHIFVNPLLPLKLKAPHQIVQYRLTPGPEMPTIMISDLKIQSNNDFKMVPDKIKGVTPTPVIPEASSTM